MSVYGYSRVSTQMQAEDGNGLDVQRRQIEGYALMHGFELAEIVVEEGVSGSVPIAERPAGARLSAKLKKGDIVIALKLDRLFRSALDALQVVEMLKAKGVSLHILELGGDVSGNGMSKLFMTIVAAFAEIERERIGERTREAKRYLASQGIFNGGKRPFGYDLAPDGDIVRLVPNAQEMAKLKRMKAMRKKGASLREIGAATGVPFKSVQRLLERASR